MRDDDQELSYEDAPRLRWRRWGRLLVTVVVFVLAVRILKGAGELYRPELSELIRGTVRSGWQALGAGWLGAYLMMNGSLVAALALTVLVDVLPSVHLFLLVSGSRLGAAAVVILVGAFDHVHHRGQPIAESCGLGSLTFLVTHLVYLPATVLGVMWIWTDWFPWTAGSPTQGIEGGALRSGGGVQAVLEAAGPVISVVAGGVLLLISLRLFDRVLDTLDMEGIRRRYFRRLGNRWVSFGTGFLLTAVTTSIAFSVAVLVPLYNRRHLRREELVPYLLGSNLSTLTDTFLVAVLSGSARAVEVMVLVFGTAAICTAGVLLGHRPVTRVLEEIYQALLFRRLWFALFVASLLAVPVLFLFTT